MKPMHIAMIWVAATMSCCEPVENGLVAEGSGAGAMDGPAGQGDGGGPGGEGGDAGDDGGGGDGGGDDGGGGADGGDNCFLPPHVDPDCSPAGLDLNGAEVEFQAVRFTDGRLDPALVQLADGCQFTSAPDLDVIESEAEFAARLECRDAVPPIASGIDWSARRMVTFGVRESPDFEVLWVLEQDGQILLGVRLPAYCGGPAPVPTLAVVLIPASATPVAEMPSRCRTGTGVECCDCRVICDPMPRLECGCPP